MAMLRSTVNHGYYQEYYKVAVGCWFTSNGRAIPKMLKFEDKEGVLRTVTGIRLIKNVNEACSPGIVQCYECMAVIDNIKCRFFLLFHPAENTWELILT